MSRHEKFLKVPTRLRSIPGGPVEVIPFNARSHNLSDGGFSFKIRIRATCGLSVRLATVTRAGLGGGWRFTNVIREIAELQDRSAGRGKTATVKAEAAYAVRVALSKWSMLDTPNFRHESAWVVEHTNSFSDAVIYVCGLHVVGDGPGRIMADVTTNSWKAMRFARKQDASRYAEDLEACNLVAAAGWRACEHVWEVPVVPERSVSEEAP